MHIENKYKGIPFWSLNEKLNKKVLSEQIAWMKKSGFGGFFMHARMGLETEYLSEEWFDIVNYCVEEAERLGLKAWVYDENGFPSGYCDGKLLEKIENRDKYMTYVIGDFDINADVSYNLDSSTLKIAKAGKNCLNIYIHTAVATVDILNDKVVEQFIQSTHEEYKAKADSRIVGFFTDEPQVNFISTPFTPKIVEYFKETYNEDIFERLGLLFVKKRGYRDFRYKYWKGMNTLMLKNWASKLYNWCDSNGYKLTGHYFEERKLAKQILGCAGSVMPFYEYEHIPGIDYLGRYNEKNLYPKYEDLKDLISDGLSSKQIGSVAAQLGKKQTIVELAGTCGWDASPKDLKKVADLQYVNGVNLMCLHLIPYSERGQRKRDYPVHFTPINPWVKENFKQFNDYFSVLGKLLSESKEIVNVGVLHPLRSCYFNYTRELEPNGFGCKELDNAFINLTEKLSEAQIPHHFLDETLLEKYGKVEDGKLILGKCTYDYIILPKIYTMDKTTHKLLYNYVQQGGKILLMDKKPNYLEGERYYYPYLESNTTLNEIKNKVGYSITKGEKIRCTLRKDKKGNMFLYAVNFGKKQTVEFQTKCRSFKKYDVLTDTYTIIPKKIEFDAGQSYILYFNDEDCIERKLLNPLYFGKKFEIKSVVDNYLVLDFAQMSKDGNHYGEKVYHMALFDALLNEKYSGDLYLKYTFSVIEKPQNLKVVLEKNHIISLNINGVEAFEERQINYDVHIFDISKYVKDCQNEIVIKLRYSQNALLYKALFGGVETEVLKHSMRYDTTIEPLFLLGNFGVYGDFNQKYEKENIILGKNFYIGKQKKEISSLIENGFPFFRGNITLKQTIRVRNTQRYLVLSKRYHLIDLFINGIHVKKIMFDDRVDISDYLKIGKNELQLVLTVGNRNCLGELHSTQLEPMLTYPSTFERFGTWHDGKSNSFMEDYAFVKTII